MDLLSCVCDRNLHRSTAGSDFDIHWTGRCLHGSQYYDARCEMRSQYAACGFGRSEGVLEVNNVTAGWQRPVQVEGIVVKDGIKKLVPVVSIEKVTTSKTLWDIIKGSPPCLTGAKLGFTRGEI